MRLLYGTSNPAKLSAMRKWLAELPLEIDGLDATAPSAPEEGKTPLQNARQKALFYYHLYRKPVFSCDSGIEILGVPEAKNPGVHARRPEGKSLTDEEMIAHYASLALQYGKDGFLPARYLNAICLITEDGTLFEYDGEDICSDLFLLSDKPHARRTPGWPLDSLSATAKQKAYWFDLSPQEQAASYKDLRPGFIAFFHRTLKL